MISNSALPFFNSRSKGWIAICVTTTYVAATGERLSTRAEALLRQGRHKTKTKKKTGQAPSLVKCDRELWNYLPSAFFMYSLKLSKRSAISFQFTTSHHAFK